MGRLDGKAALITGAGPGIGAATADRRAFTDSVIEGSGHALVPDAGLTAQ